MSQSADLPRQEGLSYVHPLIEGSFFSRFSSMGTQVEAEHVLSRLWIGGASGSDSGNYTCSFPDFRPEAFPRARVRVHVVDGKEITGLHEISESSAVEAHNLLERFPPIFP